MPLVQRVVSKSLAHGFVGGISSHFQGGKFHQGFAAAGLAQLAAPAINKLDFIPGPQGVVVRTALAATAGGVGAKLGGGKFKNGAITGAFSRLFNDELERERELSRNKRHDLGVAASIEDYIARGYTIVEGGPVKVQVPGFFAPRYYDFIVYDPVSGKNIGVEVKTTILDVIRLNSVQVNKDAAVVNEGGITVASRIPVNGVGYDTYCFGCGLLKVRSRVLRDRLRALGVNFCRGHTPGECNRQ